jgi:6-phosphogluconolactonase
MNQIKKMKKRIFPNSLELDQAFAKCIATLLNEKIEETGVASILFSGGSTPVKFFGELAQQEVDWAKVKVGLVDDRLVPITSEYSNSKLMSDHLFEALPVSNRPSFHPLVSQPFDASNNLDKAIEMAKEFGTPDIVILGMGTDGHFASLFPTDLSSEKALRQFESDDVVYTIAPSVPKFRISFSWGFLRKAKYIFVHVTGKNKLELIESQESRGELLPIDYVLTDTAIEPVIYWAP